MRLKKSADSVKQQTRRPDGAGLIERRPHSKRELLRRVNVDGARHVLDAAAEAGLKRIAVASWVGAFSSVDDDVLRDESWSTDGISGSHYSATSLAASALSRCSMLCARPC